MVICYFGDYRPDYARSRVLLEGLKRNGAIILECRSEKTGLAKYWELYQKHKEIKDKYDILIVGQSVRSRLVWLAKLISNKKVVWDAFYSLYDKYVFDSQLISPESLKARYYWWLERLACALADLILLDTEEHIKYFVKEFSVKKEKFVRVFVGTDIDSENLPLIEKDANRPFLVHFHGKYIPLQGAEYIIGAAKILEEHPDIKFNLIGSGQTYAVCRKLAEELDVDNINFIGYLAFPALVRIMNEADVCLGIFGGTPKTQRVIPNKVYEAAALKKPIITADTPAIKELFADGQSALLCQAANEKDLASKIIKLKENEELRDSIARGGYEVFKNQAVPDIIGKNLLASLKNLLKK
ncbi:MAG: glycosyltransferase [Candidatus Portnoybacteria bacterium]|nr:glycosyltransferase [Candidatus Portnoybacteria bacterium]